MPGLGGGKPVSSLLAGWTEGKAFDWSLAKRQHAVPHWRVRRGEGFPAGIAAHLLSLLFDRVT